MKVLKHNMSSKSGVFSQPLIEYSDKTKNLVKELLRESGVNKHYQRDVERSLHHSAPLPSATNAPSAEELPLEGQTVLGGRRKTPLKWRSKRSKTAIHERVKDSPEDIYLPDPPKFDQSSKERCQDLMAYEGKIPNMKNKKKEKLLHRMDQDPNTIISGLVREIEERIGWLASLEKYGAASEHKPMIVSQVALRIRDLEFLDSKRCNMLQKQYATELKSYSTAKPTKQLPFLDSDR